MNERLKELYQQAHSIRHYDGDPALDGNPPTVYWQGEVSAQRFANLIVRECMNICEQQRLKILNNPDDPSWTEHLAECQINMEQLFSRS